MLCWFDGERNVTTVIDLDDGRRCVVRPGRKKMNDSWHAAEK